MASGLIPIVRDLQLERIQQPTPGFSPNIQQLASGISRRSRSRAVIHAGKERS
jgi:hypothetical protein